MFIEQLYYEWKLHWKPLLLAPVALMLACMLFALLQSSWKENVGRTYLGFAEVFLPLAAGVIAGAIVVREPALELQLTVAQSYRQTVMRRMSLLMSAYACACCLLISGMSLLHFWFLPRYLLTWPLLAQWSMSQLIWLTPLCWFVALGMCVSIITMNSVANGAVLAAFWLVELLTWGAFHDIAWLRSFYIFATVMWIYQGDSVALPAWYFNAFWLWPHLEQLAMALLLFSAAWPLLRHTEHLLQGVTTE